MKKLFALALILALLAVAVVPVLAAGKSRSNPFAVSGLIASVDPSTQTITVVVACGNKLVKPFIGQNLTIHISEATRLLLYNPDGVATPVEFAYLTAGQKVNLNGQLANNLWTANRITVGADYICLP